MVWEITESASSFQLNNTQYYIHLAKINNK